MPITEKTIKLSQNARRFRGAVNFIFIARQKFGQKFDYSKVEYSTNNKKVCIVCNEHGEFWQTPSSHIRSVCGCAQCGEKKAILSNPPFSKPEKKCNKCFKEKNINEYRKWNTKRGIRISAYCDECRRLIDRQKAKRKDIDKVRAATLKYANSEKGKKKRQAINEKLRKKQTYIYFIACDCGKIEVRKKTALKQRTRCSKCQNAYLYKKNYVSPAIKQKHCINCDGLFMPVSSNREKLCGKCKKVKNRCESHRKRAKRFNVYYEPVNFARVLKRDKYKCKECGAKVIKPTGKNLPNEWTRGHIVPMSLGGSNTYDNVQCECRACNTKKGNKALGQQLTVFFADNVSSEAITFE